MKKNLCKKCKTHSCCYNAVLAHGNNRRIYHIILKNHPCKFLDIKTKECLIYENRFKINPYCMTIEEARNRGGLPKECLYIKNNKIDKKYIPKIDYIPDDVSKIEKKGIEYMEQMSPQEYRKKILPLIL